MKSFKILVAASVLALSATSALAGGYGEQYGSWGDQSSQSGVGSQILKGGKG